MPGGRLFRSFDFSARRYPRRYKSMRYGRKQYYVVMSDDRQRYERVFLLDGVVWNEKSEAFFIVLVVFHDHFARDVP